MCTLGRKRNAVHAACVTRAACGLHEPFQAIPAVYTSQRSLIKRRLWNASFHSDGCSVALGRPALQRLVRSIALRTTHKTTRPCCIAPQGWLSVLILVRWSQSVATAAQQRAVGGCVRKALPHRPVPPQCSAGTRCTCWSCFSAPSAAAAGVPGPACG